MSVAENADTDTASDDVPAKTVPAKTVPAKDVPGRFAGQLVPEWQKIPPPEPGELPRTPSEIEGPYFRLAAPERSNLLEPDDDPELVLTGRVLNEKGTPIAGAIVNVWSSDADGDYDMIGHRYTGYQVTDGEGRYEFTTIVPGCYYPRDAKHLHVMVQGVSSPLVTQLYIGGEPGNYEDDYYHPALLVECTEDENGTKHGSFDFVIKQVTEEENVTSQSLDATV